MSKSIDRYHVERITRAFYGINNRTIDYVGGVYIELFSCGEGITMRRFYYSVKISCHWKAVKCIKNHEIA